MQLEIFRLVLSLDRVTRNRPWEVLGRGWIFKVLRDAAFVPLLSSRSWTSDGHRPDRDCQFRGYPAEESSERIRCTEKRSRFAVWELQFVEVDFHFEAGVTGQP
jgi:hypothetical protein